MARENKSVIAKFPALKSIYCTLGISRLKKVKSEIPDLSVIPFFARTKVRYYIFGGLLLIFALASFWPRYGFEKAAWEVGRWPGQAQFHLDLAREQAENHNFASSQKEISLANNLSPSFVANYFCVVESILSEKTERARIEKEISQWEEILKKYPGFRDVYLRLALLHWQIYNNLIADSYLKKASLLSPNFPAIAKIKQFFQKNR